MAWIDQIFEANQASEGGIVRRSVSDVQKYASFDLLLEHVKERGYHLIQTGDQYVILCHGGEIKIFC